MTSIIKFCPLSGAGGVETPPCYIMQVDEFRILLDCGWSEQCEEVYLEELKR